MSIQQVPTGTVERTTYIGQYKDGFPHGNGKLHNCSTKKTILHGKWIRGCLVKGKEFDPVYGRLEYDGEFSVTGGRNGKGMEYNCFTGKKIYKGSFKNAQYHGYGIQYYGNGKKKYDGNWEFHKRHGYGISYHQNGRKQREGMWENDTEDGFGVSYNEDGQKEYTGNWTFGEKGDPPTVRWMNFDTPFPYAPKITSWSNFDLKYINYGLYYLAYVPLNIINYLKLCQEKYQQNKRIMKKESSVLPIIVRKSKRLKGKYAIIDGNHRCTVAEKMGYTYIPAIIAREDGVDNRVIQIVVCI